MAVNDSPIPLFVPSLAVVLANAESRKKAPLTREEVESIRDKSACIMMKPLDAQKMHESRGYTDVNPDNCWADWHRLRGQMVGGYLPRIVLCIPGDDAFRARSEALLSNAKITFEFQPHDPNMVGSFEAASMGRPSLTSEDFGKIACHTHVMYVLSEGMTSAAAPAVGRTFLNLGCKLLEVGGMAIKCESSGMGHSRKRWTELSAAADGNGNDRWASLLSAYVVHPIASESDVYTCGMHLLGVPDLIVSNAVIRNGTSADGSVVQAAADLFDIFAIYLISECPPGSFASGHTFRVDRDSPRYRVMWEPCRDYAEDDLFFNPFGMWRFTAS